MKRLISAAKVSAACILLFAAPAKATVISQLEMNYFSVAETDQDGNHLTGGTFANEVQNTLGANGMPVLNTAAYGCTSNCVGTTNIKDVLPDGELTYWSPTLNNGGAGGGSDVTYTGSAPVTLPFSNNAFYAPNGTGSSDSSYFQAAFLSGTLDASTTENISFSIGADDMAFAYLDGVEVCDLGGVHGGSVGTCVTPFTITAGVHTLELFFVDINQTGAVLDFSVLTSDVTTAPSAPVSDATLAPNLLIVQANNTTVPEPTTTSLFAGAILALDLVFRRAHRG